MDQLWEYTEPDGTVVPVWCREATVAVKSNSKVHICCDDEFIVKGEPRGTREHSSVSKRNKHVEESWWFVISDN